MARPLIFLHVFCIGGILHGRFFSSDFCHADFADDADFFIHRMMRNLFGGFLLKRLLTEFRGGDLFGRCRYPLSVEYVPQISRIYTDFSCFNFLPFYLFPPFLISHLSFLIFNVFLICLLFLISHFSFLIFFSCQKIEKNKQNIKRNLHYFFYFCREILNL